MKRGRVLGWEELRERGSVNDGEKGEGLRVGKREKG